MKENLETIYKEVKEHGNLIFRTGFKFDTGYYEIFVYKFNNNSVNIHIINGKIIKITEDWEVQLWKRM